MATADLMAALQSDGFALEDVNEKKVVLALVKLLQDQNGEVQNIAVKCFSPLTKKLHENQLQELVDQLCRLLTDKRLELRDIACISLKTVIVEIPSTSSAAMKIVHVLVPKLLNQFTTNANDSPLDVIDILSEVLNRFGNSLAQGASGAQLQKSIQDTLYPLLHHSRPAVRKRATVAIGSSVVHLPDELFHSLVRRLLTDLKVEGERKDYEKLRTFIGCLATLSRYSAHRLGQYLNETLPLVFQYVEFNDDELRENCLHAFDSFVLRCPTEVTPHTKNIVDLSVRYIQYDPNFQYEDDEDDEEAEAMDLDGDEDEEEDEEDDEDDYSDEDDMSWKVRKASSKLLASLIGTRSDLLQDLLTNVAPVLISRFKDREESVRTDILSTFVAFIRQVGVAGGAHVREKNIGLEIPRQSKRRKGPGGVVDMEASTAPRELLRQQVPRLAKALGKQLNGKSLQTRQMGFTLLQELVRVLDGGLEDHIGLFVPTIEQSLKGSTSGAHAKITSPNLKIELLEFLRILFATHEPEVFHPYLNRLVPAILVAAQDKFYKITAEALSVFVSLVRVIRPITYGDAGKSYQIKPIGSDELLAHMQSLYKTAFERLQSPDIDLEVKERAIMALGVIISQAGDLLPGEQIRGVAFPLLVDRLKNELTRLTTVRVITSIAESPLADTEAKQNISLQTVLPDIIPEIASYLRKSHRQLRVASLQSLETIIRRYSKQIAPDVYPNILNDVRPLLSDSDLHILPLAMSLICVIINNGPSKEIISTVRRDVLPEVVKLVLESPHLVGAGPGLEALLQVWRCVVRTGGADVCTECMDLLLQPAASQTSQTAGSKQAYSVIAQSLAVLVLNSDKESATNTQRFIKEAENDAARENMRYISLLTLGEIGRQKDLSTLSPSLDQNLLRLFGSPSEDLKQAAAFALGNVALGNLQRYMPVVLATVREGGKKRYLVLVSLKEIITRFSHHEASPESTATLESFAPELWQVLFEHTEETEEEATRNIIAECLGKLSLSQPAKFLPDLQKRLASPNAQARATVVTAIRYTFTEHVEHDDFDALLWPLMIEFLRLVKDSDLNVRRVSLTTLNSAAHNKPHLIRDSLNEIVPMLYDETVVKSDLIHVVEMGPFKHQVDDGLDTRKAAYECMYTLLETCLSRIDVFTFLQRVLSGLSDPSHDIKILTHLMLQRLAQLSPTTVAQKLDEMVEPLRTTILSKPKTNAVKQEVEKTQELVRSTARTVLVLSRLSDQGVSPRFADYVKELTAPNSPVADIMTAEAQSGLLSGSNSVNTGYGIVTMDLS
ncbi:armadillo-type protein [Phlyctochytrium arcticum]|nr:armadillo-type protein [Phlyctochytrium arcticum]